MNTVKRFTLLALSLRLCAGLLTAQQATFNCLRHSIGKKGKTRGKEA